MQPVRRGLALAAGQRRLSGTGDIGRKAGSCPRGLPGRRVISTGVSALGLAARSCVGSGLPVRPRRRTSGRPVTLQVCPERLRSRSAYTMLPAPALPGITRNVPESCRPMQKGAAEAPWPGPVPASIARNTTGTSSIDLMIVGCASGGFRAIGRAKDLGVELRSSPNDSGGDDGPGEGVDERCLGEGRVRNRASRRGVERERRDAAHGLVEASHAISQAVPTAVPEGLHLQLQRVVVGSASMEYADLFVAQRSGRSSLRSRAPNRPGCPRRRARRLTLCVSRRDGRHSGDRPDRGSTSLRGAAPQREQADGSRSATGFSPASTTQTI